MKSKAARIPSWFKNSALLALLLATLPANSEELILTFTGSESRNSNEFEVEAPWILDWRVTTDGAYESAVDISLVEAGTGVHQGQVLMTKYPGNGVRMFNQGGKFYFRIDSAFATYTLKVIELSKKEAEQYTPKSRSILDD